MLQKISELSNFMKKSLAFYVTLWYNIMRLVHTCIDDVEICGKIRHSFSVFVSGDMYGG